ncbi:hypothetical protein [Streptomyces sp. NPDC001970]
MTAVVASDAPSPEGAHASRPRLPRPLLTELRRGVGPWTGAATTAVVAFAMYSKAGYLGGWQNHWTDATDLLRIAAALLCGPLAVAAGCWHGGRERRRRTSAWLGSLPRGPLRRTLVAATPAALWPAAGYLVAATGCLLATWPYAGGDGPHLALVAADAVTLASLGTLGFVVGRLVAWRFTAPLLAVLTYVGLGCPSYSEAGARWLDPAVQHSYAWDRPVWWFGAASIVWAGGLAAAALLAYAARRRTTALVPLTAACAAAVLIAQTGDGLWRPDPEAMRRVCDHGTPQVCLPYAERHLLPEASAALAGLNARLRGIPGAPTRWVAGPGERAAGDLALPSPSFEAIRGKLTSPDAYAANGVGALLSQTCAQSDYDAPDWERASAVNSAVFAWLSTAEGQGPYIGPAEQEHLTRLEAKSPAEARTYLTRYLAADRCKAEEVPLP